MLTSFSTFILEAGLISDLSKRDKFSYEVVGNEKKTPEKLKKDGYSKFSSLGNHDLYQSHNGSHHKYIAHNRATGKIDISMLGSQHKHKKGTTFNIQSLAGRTGSSLKAHDLYHHLITKHDHILVGTTHSIGGQKVWQKLAKKPGVGIHGWLNGKPVNLDPHDSEQTHVPDEEFYSDDKIDRATNDIFHTKLIAHRKSIK